MKLDAIMSSELLPMSTTGTDGEEIVVRLGTPSDVNVVRDHIVSSDSVVKKRP